MMPARRALPCGPVSAPLPEEGSRIEGKGSTGRIAGLVRGREQRRVAGVNGLDPRHG